MYDNMSERGRQRWRALAAAKQPRPPSLPRSHFVAPALSRCRRARNRQMKWEFMPPLSLRSSPPLHSVLRTPPIWLSLTASLTHSLTIPNWLSFSTTQAMVTVEPAWARTIVLFGVRKSTWPPGPLSSPEAPPRSTAAALGVTTVSEMVPPSVPRERERESVKSVKGKA